MAIKGIKCDLVPVDLLNGESESQAHLFRNPLGFVPSLEISGGFQTRYITQSMAILNWIECLYPTPALIGSKESKESKESNDHHSLPWLNDLPANLKPSFIEAKIFELSNTIVADTQPLQNLGPQQMYSDDPEKRKSWAVSWIENGLSAYETLVQQTAGKYSIGNSLTLADLCLIPQVYNALRYEVNLTQYPNIKKIYETCLDLESCANSHPDRYKP